MGILHKLRHFTRLSIDGFVMVTDSLALMLGTSDRESAASTVHQLRSETWTNVRDPDDWRYYIPIRVREIWAILPAAAIVAAHLTAVEAVEAKP